MFGVAAEFQNIPLRDSRVLEQLPAGVWQTLHEAAALMRRETLNGVRKVHMRRATFEQIRQVLAQQTVRVDRTTCFLDRFLFGTLCFLLQAHLSQACA